ncbi:MAG: PHP domain-containing protein [Zoogloeaceae bacterium]|nr:PHP domain-containing protein [Zoogloeaceae bacterium]
MFVPTFDDFDFHAHSSVSDGLLRPGEVVRWAQTRGTRWFALTDHDDVRGLQEARAVAAELGIGFVNGVEISIEWQRLPIHIVGLGFDAGHPGLCAGLAAIRDGRQERARRMGAAFADIGIPGVLAGALKYAENPELISRAHFARYLVEIGLFRETGKVFEHYLTPGKPGYVEHRWPDLAQALAWIRAAGGVAVVAHPGRYALSGQDMLRFLAEFRAAGGQAIEVACGSHTPEHIRHFTRLARQLGLHASRGSDFHAPGDCERLAPLPDSLEPVWALLKLPESSLSS